MRTPPPVYFAWDGEVWNPSQPRKKATTLGDLSALLAEIYLPTIQRMMTNDMMFWERIGGWRGRG